MSKSTGEKRRKRKQTTTPVDVNKILSDIRASYGIKSELFDQKNQQDNLMLKPQNNLDLSQLGWVQQQRLQKQSQNMFNLQRETAKKQQEEWRRQQE